MNEEKRFVVMQRIWIQTSGDYHSECRYRTLVVSSEATVREIFDWAKKVNALGVGDVVLTESDDKA